MSLKSFFQLFVQTRPATPVAQEPPATQDDLTMLPTVLGMTVDLPERKKPDYTTVAVAPSRLRHCGF